MIHTGYRGIHTHPPRARSEAISSLQEPPPYNGGNRGKWPQIGRNPRWDYYGNSPNATSTSLFPMINAMYGVIIYLITKRLIVKDVIDHAFNDSEHLKGENHETGDSLKTNQKKRSIGELRLLTLSLRGCINPAHRKPFGMKPSHLRQILHN